MASFLYNPASAHWPLRDAIVNNAKANPDHPYFVYPKPEPATDLATITFREFGRATDRAAHLVRPGRAGPEGEVVALIGLADGITYQAVLVGMFVAGLVPFPISPRNSPPAVAQLLKKTDCHRLIATGTTLAPLIAAVQKQLGEEGWVLTVDEMPTLQQVYPYLAQETENHPAEPYPPPPGPIDLDGLAGYLHSSGSTGFPKAIMQTHRIHTHWNSFTASTDVGAHYESPVAAMLTPGFHMAGFYTTLIHPMYRGVTVAMYPPQVTAPHMLPVMPTPDNVLENVRRTNSRAVMCFPAFLVEWAKNERDVETLKGLKHIGVSGGAIPPKVGDFLHNAGANICALYAGTEFGGITRLVRAEEGWEWLRFGSKHKIRWKDQGDGTFECQILTTDEHHLCVENLPDVRGYATSDLWVPHPTKKDLWKIVGRIDDVVVHSNSEKTVPGPMEDIIISDPRVAATMIFGRGRDRAGILIEPVKAKEIDVADPVQVAALRNELWPVIEEANAIAPAFSRIFKEMILFTPIGKPLPRSPKGTVMRKAAVAAFEAEIDAIYDAVETNVNATGATKPPPVVWAGNAEGLKEWLLDCARDLTQREDVSPEEDLFNQGFDSLSATILPVEQNVVYAHPSVVQLARYLERVASGAESAAGVDGKERIVEMVDRYALAPVAAAAGEMKAEAEAKPSVVLLTGSTGSLGSYILATLLADARIKKVYALNRGTTSAQLAKQRAAFTERGLDVDASDGKVVLVEGAVSDELGLLQIAAQITHVIHNAWTLDFNLALAAFEPHVKATKELLALAQRVGAKFVFTSSVASVLGWDKAQGAVPEALIDLKDVKVAGSNGYGQGKYVAEQIVAKSGVPATILRIGQIAGAPPSGAWSTSDWFPILVKTSIGLGALPTTEGVVSWIDFITASQAVVDAAFASSRGTDVLNVVHSRPVAWNTVVSGVRDVLAAQNKPVELVSFEEWYARLEKASTAAEISALPGIKLLAFFKTFASASTSTKPSEESAVVEFSTGNCDAVKNAGVLGREHIAAWVGYWNKIGFL
ncbi:Non-canonical non-ribosomal peptide synthetase FUB8 [Mycena kentingensis (nom. inval.)]|nr:Non-canonical non-ribosomal peptide synthetase FUB8 [Mycena kentingensis (nom. inval.)]